jgi:hypothetical protein
MRAQAPVVCVDSRAVIARLKRLGKGALRALGVPRASALQGEQTIRERTRRKRKGRQAAMRPRILRFRCQAPISRLVDLPQRTSPTPEVWSGKMRRDRMSKTLALLAATAAVVSLSTRADAMRAITANDGMLWRCDQRFHAYGYNYGPQAWRWLCGCVPPARGGPIPSFRYFDHPTSRSLRWISKDFARARRHGANTIRIYIELRHVMRTPTRPRARTLRALAALLKSAERRGVFLDITGNLVWPGEVAKLVRQALRSREMEGAGSILAVRRRGGCSFSKRARLRAHVRARDHSGGRLVPRLSWQLLVRAEHCS